MALFCIKCIPLDVKKDIVDVTNMVPKVFKYHTGEVMSEVITYKDIDLKESIYICLEDKSKATIYYIEGKGHIIFSISNINFPNNQEQNIGFIREGEQVDIKTGFPCLVIVTATYPLNKFVVVKE